MGIVKKTAFLARNLIFFILFYCLLVSSCDSSEPLIINQAENQPSVLLAKPDKEASNGFTLALVLKIGHELFIVEKNKVTGELNMIS